MLIALCNSLRTKGVGTSVYALFFLLHPWYPISFLWLKTESIALICSPPDFIFIFIWLTILCKNRHAFTRSFAWLLQQIINNNQCIWLYLQLCWGEFHFICYLIVSSAFFIVFSFCYYWYLRRLQARLWCHSISAIPRTYTLRNTVLCFTYIYI